MELSSVPVSSECGGCYFPEFWVTYEQKIFNLALIFSMSPTLLLIILQVNSGRSFTVETTINNIANSNGGITLNAIAMYNSVVGVALDSAGVSHSI